MKESDMSAYITGLGVYLPNEPVTNDQIEAVLGEINGQPSQLKDAVLDRNGIKTRYYAIDRETGQSTHTNAQMTAAAIHAMADDRGLAVDEIQLLACGTSSPDQFIPSHASMVHGLVGCGPCELISTAGVCCSSVAALKHAYLSVKAGEVANAVATGSELASSYLRASHFRSRVEADVNANFYLAFEHEFLRWMLSDGAGAVLLEPRPREQSLSLRIDWIDIISFANELETCMYCGALKREDGSLHPWREVRDVDQLWREGYLNLGQDVEVLQANMLPVAMRRSLEQVRAKHQLQPDDIDWMLPHMSSHFFQQPIYELLVEMGIELPYHKWFTNLATKGNTGAASVLIMLEELWSSGRLAPGQRLLCVVPESARFTFGYLHLTVM